MFPRLPWAAFILFALAIGLWKPLPRSRARFRAGLILLVLWLLLWAGSSLASIWQLDINVANIIGLALLEIAAVQIVVGPLFDFATEKTRLPHLAGEMALIGCYVFVIFKLFFSLGVNLTGIFATSAVATAVIGLAIQDMLANLASGVALEFEDTVKVGDFVRCGDATGWVKHVRLRHTMLETPDGDRIMVPNSFLTRSSLTVMGTPHRHMVPFAMPYTHAPQELLETITHALQASPITGVASHPAPVCIALEMTEESIRYAAVVWMARAGDESQAISAVLNRIYFALRRAGIPLADFTHYVQMRTAEEEKEVNPAEILRRTPLFRLVDEADLYLLGAKLRHLSFAPGEFIIRQGEAGDSMYFVTHGQVAINYVGADLNQVEVAVISNGDFFGEASLLTGEKRSANAIAVGRVDCLRLDKAGLEGLIAQRSDLAEDISRVMAHRQTELAVTREKLDQETARLREAEQQIQLLSRIRKFFDLNASSAKV